MIGPAAKADARLGLVCLFAILEMGCPGGWQQSSNLGEDPAPGAIRLIDYLARAQVQSPLAERKVTSELEDFRAAHGAEDFELEGVPPWLVKRVPLLVDRRRRIEERLAIALPPPSQLRLPIRIPWACRLSLYLGVAGAAGAQGARFEIAFEPKDQDERQLLVRELDPGNRPGDQSWVEQEIDLGGYAGTEGELIFRTANLQVPTEPSLSPAFVANPVLMPAAGARDLDERPNVLLIGIDTLRADHLGAYGYPRPTSPHLDSLAAEGIRFARVSSTAPWTLPSFTSILTSLYPSRHGAGRGGRGGYTRVHPETALLSEIFYSRGYRTAGMVGSYIVSSRYGLEQGYEVYRHPYKAAGFESAGIDAPQVIDFIRDNVETPFFFFWHIMDPHLPYMAPAEFTQKFGDPEYRGRFRSLVDFQYLVQRPGRRRYAHEGAPSIPPMTEADARRIVDFYDAEIAETDANVGKVLNAIKFLGLWQKTLVVVIADHGEGLAEHGHYHHGYTLYEDQLRVPLILRYPGGPQGKVFEERISTIDLAPMLLDVLGLPIPEDMQGVNPLARASRSRTIFAEYPTLDSSSLKAVYLDDFKYLHDPLFRQEELFRLDEDPAESRNLLTADAGSAARARTTLDRFREHNLNGGRYHLLIKAPTGAEVVGRLTAGDVFDANAVLVPGGSEPISLDLERRTMRFEARLPEGRAELFFWFRGEDLRLAFELDGEPMHPAGLRYGDGRTLPHSGAEEAVATTAAIPVLSARDVALRETGAALWLEDTGLRPLRTMHTAEDVDRLRALGYVD